MKYDESLFRRDAETNTRDACPTRNRQRRCAMISGERRLRAGGPRSPDSRIRGIRSMTHSMQRVLDTRDALDQSQRPQESNEAASVQTPDLVSPRTTTMTSRPGREPLAIRQ